MNKFITLLLFLVVSTTASFGQQVKSTINSTLSGQVLDEKTKQPIPGVSLYIKGTTHGVITDAEGHFYFQTGQKFPYSLVVSFIGYQKQDYIAEGTPVTIYLKEEAKELEEIVVTSRRRKESVQDVPIPITVIGGAKVAETGSFNVNRLKEFIPSVQLYSSNPRNTSLSIRGLGTTFGLTNDGIDPGVGFYVDGVYYARPAATTMDFIDIEQVEVLRGPQGTLFGKNTSAGNFNVTTKKASFTPGANFELSYGNYGYIQAKASVTGPLSKTLAARISFSGTQRDGLLYNVATQQKVNDLNNLGLRSQLLFVPSDKVKFTLIGDFTQQNPNGYAQVIAGVAPTLRASYRQFENIIKDLNYQLPSRNPYDRLIDHDSPWRSGQKLGGVSLNADIQLGPGTLTATSAWRFWDWDPSNDRDFTGLQALKTSAATSYHEQWSQELRWAGTFSSKLSAVFGAFVFGQNLKSNPDQTEEGGSATWRFNQSTTSALWKTPGLFEGYGIKTRSNLNTLSAAVFGQLDIALTNKISLMPGLRYNYDAKDLTYSRKTYGGLQTTDAALIALKKLVYSDQAFDADVTDRNFSGQVTLAYKQSKNFNTFLTYSTGYKPVGLNLGGLPTLNGQPLLDLATIKPEGTKHLEVGFKTRPSVNTTFNLTAYNTDISDYQTLVQTPDPAVNRGYLANAEGVRVRGIEVDGTLSLTKHFSFYGNVAYTDAIYTSFTNAPVPLEETGGKATFKDVSGGQLPGVSKWATSFGAEFTSVAKVLGQTGEFYIATDVYARSDFSSSPSPSKYLNVEGYSLLNARIGFRAAKGVSISIWGRNVLDQNYFEQLLPAGGNAGQYAAVLGDQRTYGITLRHSL
ncbi:TonB-dependent receptor [Aquirufa sp.]|jgi:iron complex outermembrane receptor protein|uniref:TonB-dependent receptor n=1 Tax=Aquirufa sp. TaxID=2676249 RepID=UPI0037830513